VLDSWTADEPESGKPETINGANIYEVELKLADAA